MGHFEQYNFLEFHNLSVPLFDFGIVVALEFVDKIVEVVFDDDDDPVGDKIVVDIGSALEEIPLEYFVDVFGEASFGFDDDVGAEKDGLVVGRIEIYFEAEPAGEGGFADQNMAGNTYFGYFFEELLVHMVDFVQEYFDFRFELVDYLFGLCFHLLFHRK